MYSRTPGLNRRIPAALCAIPILVLLASACWGDVDRAAPGLPPPADVAAPPPDALRTTTGLFIKVIAPGHGRRHPRATDRVTVHYTGWTTDGRMFDSSVARGEPAEFRLTEVIPGWTEGVQRMVEGETARLWIPEPLAYRGAPGQPQGMLVFDVELVRIQ